MEKLHLHSFRRCPFAIRVRMVLEEKGLSFSVTEEDLDRPSEALLRHHPEGKVPLLLHGDLAVHESAIITEYLEDAFPEVVLMPASAQDRAKVRLLTYWCNHIFKPDLDAYKYSWGRLTKEEQTGLLLKLSNHLQKIETTLGSGPFLFGQALTLADIHVFPFYRQLQKAHPDFESQLGSQKLNSWLERIVTRPSFARVMAKASTL